MLRLHTCPWGAMWVDMEDVMREVIALIVSGDSLFLMSTW